MCVNVAAAFTGQPMMPTLLPAQVSFVGLFVNAWLSGRRSRGLHVHFSSTQTVRTEMHRIFFLSQYNGNVYPPAERKPVKYLVSLLT